MPTVDYDEYLFEELKDLEYAAGYLTACFKEGEDVFLLGIRNVAKAQGDIKALSDATNLNRESLFESVTTVLDKLGFALTLKPKMQGTDAA